MAAHFAIIGIDDVSIKDSRKINQYFDAHHTKLSLLGGHSVILFRKYIAKH